MLQKVANGQLASLLAHLLMGQYNCKLTQFIHYLQILHHFTYVKSGGSDI